MLGNNLEFTTKYIFLCDSPKDHYNKVIYHITLSHNVVLSTPLHERVSNSTTLVMIA